MDFDRNYENYDECGLRYRNFDNSIPTGFRNTAYTASWFGTGNEKRPIMEGFLGFKDISADPEVFWVDPIIPQSVGTPKLIFLPPWLSSHIHIYSH